MWAEIKHSINSTLGTPLDMTNERLAHTVFYNLFRAMKEINTVQVFNDVYGAGVPSEHYRGSSATEVILPAELSAIGSYAFFGSSLKRITIPPNVERIETYTFNGCPNLEEVKFLKGSKLNNIGIRAFAEDQALIHIELPESLINGSIDGSAFEGCTSLWEIRVPWAEGQGPSGAPWGAPQAVVVYDWGK